MTERRRLEPGELAEQGPAEAVRLPLDLVDPSPDNPRRALVEIPELAASIKEFGLLQAVAVRRMEGDRYQLVAGHRRRAAFLLLQEREPHEVQWRSIPSIIRTETSDERARLMLISAQVHSRNWSTKEEATVLEALAVEHTLIEIGRMVHRSEPWVSKRLRVYSDSVLSGYVQSGRLTVTVADELRPVKDPDQRRQFAEQAVAEEWTPDQARKRVRALHIDRQLAELGRRTTDFLALLASVQAEQIPIETFRDLQVLRGRIEALSAEARGERTGPKFPSIEAAERRAGVKPGRLAKQRRTRLKID